MVTRIGLVVEGHGEVDAAPVLIRRIALRLGIYDIDIGRPFRVRKGQMLTGTHLSRAIKVLAARDPDGLLVLVDSDDDDPEDLKLRVTEKCGRPGTQVVVAVREYEAWFLAAIQSLRDHPLMRPGVDFQGDPDIVANPKALISALMIDIYRETVHQASLSAALDLQQARSSESFCDFSASVEAIILQARR